MTTSWLLETLLRNRLLLKSEGNIESNFFNDLLVVESKIKELYNNGLLSDFDIEIIDFVSDGKPLVKSKDFLGKDRTTIAKNFSMICSRIAFFLGGHFTDEGLIDELKEEYNLTEEQLERAKDYIQKRKGTN